MNSLKSVLVLLAVASLPPTALADETIDQTRPLRADAAVSVVNCAGVIDVEGWDKDQIALTGRLGAGAEKLLVEGDERRLRIEVKLPRFAHNVEDSELRLRVPLGASLDLDGVSANLVVRGLRGPLKAKTVSGDLRVTVDSPSVQVQTISGQIYLEAPSRDTQVKSVSGDLSIKGPRGELIAETVSGDVRLEGGSFDKLRLKSVSGNFRVDGALSDAARAELDTLSGNIELALPAGTSAAATLYSSSGDVSSEFGALGEETRKAKLTLGDGQAELRLHSFSGDIELLKK